MPFKKYSTYVFSQLEFDIILESSHIFKETTPLEILNLLLGKFKWILSITDAQIRPAGFCPLKFIDSFWSNPYQQTAV